MTAPADASVRLAFDVDGRTVSGLWLEPPSSIGVAVIAHGAGNGMTHAYLAGVADGLAGAGLASMRFNFPYMEDGRKAPDRAPVLMATCRAALREAETRGNWRPVVAGGKSLGGRMFSMVAAEDGRSSPAEALAFFGYPLHAPGKADQPRDGHLGAIEVPMLFIEGTRDPFARFDLIEATVERLGPRARMHVVDGGDHSHRVRGVRRSDHDIGVDLGSVAGAFYHDVLG